MARIHLPHWEEVNPLLKLLFALIRFATAARTGKALLGAPMRAHAQHTGLFFGMAMMENAQDRASSVPAQWKSLASLRVATQIGCPF